MKCEDNTTITTKRLILRPVQDQHLSIHQQILRSDELTRYLPRGRAYTEQEILNYHNNRVAHWRHGFGTFILFAKNAPNIGMGYVGVEYCPNPTYSDIRFALLPDFQGKGYIQEAGQAVIEATFALGKHHKIYGVALTDNAPSIAVLKKLGMQADSAEPYGVDARLQVFSIENTAK